MRDFYISIPKDYSLTNGELEYVSFPDPHLVSCSFRKDDKVAELILDTNGFLPLAEANMDHIEIKRFLMNCGLLFELCGRYSVSLAPDNIFVDINLMPHLLDRNIGTLTESEFISQYKALIACMLNPQYTYNDYHEGGDDLYLDDASISGILALNGINEIRQGLEQEYLQQRTEINDRFELIKKGNNKRLIIYLISLSTVLIISIILNLIGFIFIIPNNNRIIDAYAAYLNSDYIEVQLALEDIPVEDLPYMSKYLLAISYLKTVDLSQEEKQNEQLQITTKTEELLFDYWIHIGREEYENAIDDAERLNSDAHLFYAYVCYRIAVENDLSMNGSDKSDLLSELDSKIDQLSSSIRDSQDNTAGL